MNSPAVVGVTPDKLSIGLQNMTVLTKKSALPGRDINLGPRYSSEPAAPIQHIFQLFESVLSLF